MQSAFQSKLTTDLLNNNKAAGFKRQAAKALCS
jgi:hypothetical protein